MKGRGLLEREIHVQNHPWSRYRGSICVYMCVCLCVNVGARIGPRPRRRPHAGGDIGMTARGEIRRAGEMTRVGRTPTGN